MLLFGYLGEIKKMHKYLSLVLGFIFFIITFYFIYDKYVSPQTLWLFIAITFIWFLYGIAFILSYSKKNTMYNILDIFSKNVYSFFIVFKIMMKSFVL